MTEGLVCMLCGRQLRVRWWERGLLAPLPMCRSRAQMRECERLFRARLLAER